MQIAAPPRWGLRAFLYGGITGFVLAIVQILLVIFGHGVGPWIALLLGFAAPFVIGIFVAKRVGKVGAASISGLWMGVICGVVMILAFTLLLLVFGIGGGWEMMLRSLRNDPRVTNPDQVAQGLVLGFIIVGIFYLLIIMGCGAGLGALGGLIGKSQSPYRNYRPYSPQYGYGVPPVPPQYPPAPPYPPAAQYPPVPPVAPPVPPVYPPEQAHIEYSGAYPPPPTYYEGEKDAPPPPPPA